MAEKQPDTPPHQVDDDEEVAVEAARAEAGDGEGEEESVEVVKAAPPLIGLTILPPRQNSSTSPGVEGGDNAAVNYTLPLPPVRPEEYVQSLKLALSEVVGLAHFTNYRMEVEAETEPPEENKPKEQRSKEAESLPLVSPFTGKNAIVCIPAALKTLDIDPSLSKAGEEGSDSVHHKAALEGVLDELTDIQSTPGIKNGTSLRIVLERYNAAAVQDHVQRFRHLMDGAAPSVESLVEDAENIKANASVHSKSAEERSTEKKDEPEKERDDNVDPASVAAKPLPELPPLTSVRPDNRKLADYFYLAAGEDRAWFAQDASGGTSTHTKENNNNHNNLKSSKKKSKSKPAPETETKDSVVPDMGAAIREELGVLPPKIVSEKLHRLNQLDAAVHIPCTVQYSGFHPPPRVRALMGDLAYLEMSIEEEDGTFSLVYVTAATAGFYVNRTSRVGLKQIFDPAPASEPCFSHTLLDCLLQASPRLAQLWKVALVASKEKSEVSAQINKGVFSTLFRLAIRGDVGGHTDPALAMKASSAVDANMTTPSWLVTIPKPNTKDDRSLWNRNLFHQYSPVRAEEEIVQTFGVDLRGGGTRDWNEELQIARELPTSTFQERLDRARVIHKGMTEFGEAALAAVKAITEGFISPMNPNEGTRTQVFLHNNIFVSRALDVGPETFRLVRGDAAAKKVAGREIQCIKTFHRMENSGLHTLGTVLIDYLGSRFICQSILPGILQNDLTHTILLGSVDVEIAMKCDEDFQKLVRENIGDALNLLSRPMYTMPLTTERFEECKKMKRDNLPDLPGLVGSGDQEIDFNQTMVTCAPLETKGIRGSDRRTYVLDFGRMTPRDANWVPEDAGGTGKWEATSSTGAIPHSLKDDEFVMNLLRPELINQWIRSLASKHSKEHLEALAKKKSENGDSRIVDEAEEAKFHEEQKALTDSLRLNVNVFLPDVRVVDSEQMKLDEEKVREASVFLWDEVLPRLTRTVRERNLQTTPYDGLSLTELLHRSGVNCRYLGRLATLAREEEELDNKTDEDAKNGRLTGVFNRKTMPLSWLELLETEIIARSAKHVLDKYLTESGSATSAQPAQLIASFLSAIASEREETAAQTETRLEKSDFDDDDFQALSIFDVGGYGDAVPVPARSRYEIWGDIEQDIARRFRYSLILFNKGNKSGRANHIPLLRRVCQRTGVRLVAKNYDVGGRCYTEGNTSGGRLTASFPISSLDIVDVVPLMKHCAAYHEGFSPCSFGPVFVTPPLQISLVDAKGALERAHLQMNTRGLNRALELAQEAASLYHRVTENGAHPGVVECLELMTNVFLEANDPSLAITNGAKTLGLAVQSGGFDGRFVFNLHLLMFQMLFSVKQFDICLKHLRAGMYLLELSVGSNHPEQFEAIHKLGALYSYEDYDGKYSNDSVRIFRELEKMGPNDRVMEGFITHALAKSLAENGQFKEAVETEQQAYKSLSRFLPSDHPAMKDSSNNLQKYAEQAVREGNRSEELRLKQMQEQKAEAVASGLVAEEGLKKKKQNKKKKGKK